MRGSESVDKKHQEQKPVTIADLYPNLSPEEQAEVEETFHGYPEITWRIHQRLEREGRLDEVLKEIREHRNSGDKSEPLSLAASQSMPQKQIHPPCEENNPGHTEQDGEARKEDRA
jgi:hypothetical protein